ncbi:hypothetical protein ONE63_007543 [Megalurothrips usitatus]|uniref:Regulator of G-protein signaling 7 n=1 Tax=Megalurothrips usitatus TaxID=439358 RepID=A0AAV7XUZ1_9NEOP|nr:hypothetical protein ONE63_007543 [Megalurothrips usitatus]
MVTMNTDKAGGRRRMDDTAATGSQGNPSQGGGTGGGGALRPPSVRVALGFGGGGGGGGGGGIAEAALAAAEAASPAAGHRPATLLQAKEDNPNAAVYKKMEAIIERMQDEATGVPVKTVKSLMAKIPSVFTGADLIQWTMKNLDIDDVSEALHLGHLMSSHGYLFPIDDHVLTVRNDNTFYRFQTPYFWPSNMWEPENTDYAVYLCKRTMQNKTRLELADYEAENLARLQKMFSRKWEFIFMQAEAQSKVDKRRDKLERKVLDSQERAFWDVHRPVPGCVNTTEINIKKICSNSTKLMALPAATPAQLISRQIQMLKQRLDRRNIKLSKVAESYISFYEQYQEYDPFLTPPEVPNPWVADSAEFWDYEKQVKDVSARRVKRWAFSLKELLADPAGREHFGKFLDKEFSGENLKFWETVQALKMLPQQEVPEEAQRMWGEFMGEDASVPINVDGKSFEATKKNVEDNPDRWSYDEAAAHVYHLMKTDSYSRYLRSDMYKDFLSGSKKKVRRYVKHSHTSKYFH